MSKARSAKITGFLEWIAPPGGLEALAGEPRVLNRIQDVVWSTEAEVDLAADAIGRLERGESLAPEHASALEEIVLPQERPVFDVVGGTFDTPAPPFQHFGSGAARQMIEAAIPSIGRIELPGHPSLPYGGTGLVVGDDLLMTNRHVAEMFTVGLGREDLSFRPGQTAAIDFLQERGSTQSQLFRVVRVIMVHPYWDMALLGTEGLGDVAALKLTVADPADLQERDVAVIGYPALDLRNNVELQTRIFRGIFNVKRMQPGRLRDRREIESFHHSVSAVTHDSSTLGGKSGSAVIDVGTGMVVALHFAGRYLQANYAVPTRELALDRRVVEAGVAFEEEVASAGPVPWERFWTEADPPRGRGEPPPVTAAAVAPRVKAESLSWSIPLELTVRIGGAAAAAAPAAAGGGIEALRPPFRDEDFIARRGYDEQFLGIPVPVPRILDESVVSRLDNGSTLLPYEHFSVALHKLRRLALFAAANVDADPGRKRPEPGRDYSRKGLTGLGENDQDEWFSDPRVPAIHQLPDGFFTKDRATFDKGHIVRHEDVAWGDSYDEVRRASGDTFLVTNCSPQIARFNRSNLKGVWGELENLILAQAATERYCIFAGPVMRDDDPIFRGVDDDGTVRVAIPRRFWKIVVARGDGGLQTFAFLLEQDLTATDLEFAVDELWRSRMISVPDLEQILSLIAFPTQLHASDQTGTASGAAVRAGVDMESVVLATADRLVRTPHLDILAEQPLLPAASFRVYVHADQTHVAIHQESAPIDIVPAPPAESVAIEVWLVASRHFRVLGERLRSLVVRRGQRATERLTFALQVVEDPAAFREDEPFVMAIFSHGGRPSGRIRRTVAVAIPIEAGV